MADLFELFSEIMDKLIDTQVQSAQVTSDLKNSVNDNSQHLKDLKELLTKVNAHFSNGFRQELKNTISDAILHVEQEISAKATQSQTEAEEILSTVIAFKSAIESPRLWLRAFIFLGSLFGVIAAIVTVVLKLMGQS